MVKNIIIVFSTMVLLFVQSCVSQNNEESNEIAKKLSFSYSKAMIENNPEIKKQFFEIFPSNFYSFKKIYGFTDGNKFEPGYLYDVYQTHLDFFCDLKNSVPKKKYYKKLISLGVDGEWQADAVNSLQKCLQESISDDLPLTISILNDYSNQKIKNFWYFLFDGPHPSVTIPIDIYKLRILNNKIAILADEAFQEVHRNSR